MFTHPHVHSINSPRDGMIKIEDAIKISIQNNEAFCITDHGNIGSWMEYYHLSKKYKIKPFFGIECYINKNRNYLFEILNKLKDKNIKEDLRRELNQKRDEIKKLNHLVLIAKNENGMYNIIQLINDAYVNYFYSKPIIDYTSLFSMNKEKDYGVIVTSACMASPLNSFDKEDEGIEWINLMKEYFGEDFYLEVQVNNIKEQIDFNKKIINLSKKTNTKMIMGTDSHYLLKEDYEAHQDLLLLQDKKKKEDLTKVDTRILYENKKGERKVKRVKEGDLLFNKYNIDEIKVGDVLEKGIVIIEKELKNRAWIFTSDILYFKSEKDIRDEIHKYHKELKPFQEEILKSNYDIYNKVEEIHFNKKVKLPKIDNADKIFVDIIKQNMKEMGLVNKKYVERIKFELSIIKRFGFETYFLILYDLIKWAKENKIPIGTGRGSAVGSLIAYVLGIHRINPYDERWDLTGEGLPFTRFLALDKLFSKIIIQDKDGNKKELMEYDEIKIKRDEETLTILAIELQEGDELIDE